MYELINVDMIHCHNWILQGQNTSLSVNSPISGGHENIWKKGAGSAIRAILATLAVAFLCTLTPTVGVTQLEKAVLNPH